METYIKRLGTLGIQCDLILFHSYDKWGFSSLTREEALEYLKYAVKKLSPLMNLAREQAGNYKDEAYMVYYGKHCTTVGKLNLPVENEYDVEVINV